MQDLSALEGKTIAELREIGKILGITDSTLKKKELLNAIIEAATSDSAPAEAAPAEETPRKRGRRPRMSVTKAEENSTAESTEPAANTEQESPATESAAPVAEQPKRRGRKPKALKEQEAALAAQQAEFSPR